MGLKRVMWVRRYQGQCRALRPLGHQGYRLRNHKKDQPLCSGYKGTPFRHPHSEQRQPARAHAVGPVLGPHAHTDRTRDTRDAEPWPPAPEDGRPGEGQRLTPGAPHIGGRPPPPGTAPHHPRGMQPPQGMQAKGTVLGSHTNTPAPQQPAQWAGSWGRDGAWPQAPPTTVEGTSPGTSFRHPHSEQRRPARAHAVRPVLGPHARTDRTRDTRVAEPWPHAPADGRPEEGQRLTPGAPRNGGRPPPPGDGPPPPPRHAAPTGHAGQGDSVGPLHPHTRAHSTWVADPNSPPSGRAVGGGTAPDLRRPSQWWKAPPPGTPFRHSHSEQRQPARAHAVGPVLGPHARIDRTRDTRVAEPRLPAPEDRRPGEGQRLTPGAPHNGGRPPPPGTAPRHSCGTQPPWACRPRGQCWAPTPTHPRPQHVGGGPQQPGQWAGSRGRDSASDAPHNGGRHPPRGRPSATPTASNAGPQGRTLWGRCWVPTPATTAHGTHGPRKPSCPLQRTGGRGRDST